VHRRTILRRLRALGALLVGLAACVPGPGACRLPALHGRVVDADTGAAIPEATVIEWWRGAGVAGGPQPTRHLRFAVTDGEGRFAFPAEAAPSASLCALRAYEPTHGFAHPRYGLVRGAASRDADGALVLRGSLSDATARRGDLQAACTTASRDEWERELASRICPDRFPSSSRPPTRER
jgi:hypothetical protein